MTEHQLDDADVDSIAQQPAGALVPQIVPVQIDLPQLVAIDPSSRPHALGFVPVSDQQEGFPGRLEAVLELAVRCAEHECVQPQLRPPLQDRREPPLRIERDAPVLRILGVGPGDHDLVLRPLDVAVLDAQHLPLPAARLESADDAIVHRRSRALVLG